MELSKWVRWPSSRETKNGFWDPKPTPAMKDMSVMYFTSAPKSVSWNRISTKGSSALWLEPTSDDGSMLAVQNKMDCDHLDLFGASRKVYSSSTLHQRSSKHQGPDRLIVLVEASILHSIIEPPVLQHVGILQGAIPRKPHVGSSWWTTSVGSPSGELKVPELETAAATMRRPQLDSGSCFRAGRSVISHF